jgi:hypothetical protein
MTTETQTQDKNQLTLFELLTAEQEVKKADIIAKRAIQAKKAFDKDTRIVNLLLENGFIEGTHFKSNSRIVKIIRKFDVGDYKNEKLIDIEVEDTEGNVSILYDRLNNNNIEKVSTSIWMNSESKLECSSVTNSNRSYKPKSLFEKLILKNQKAVKDFEEANKDLIIKKYTIKKYKSLYPDAEITLSRDYTTYDNGYNRNKYVHFDVLTIKFKSGSYVSLRLGLDIDKEYIYKKYNVIEAKASITDLLNNYNNQ